MTTEQTVQTAEATATDSFVAYEYTAIRAPRALGSLYQDTYRGFGWTVESTDLADPIRPLPLTPSIQPTQVTLNLKRDRGIRNRQLVQELQRTAETSLARISRLERTKTSHPMAAAIGFGIVGAAALAGSVFTMNGGLLALSIVLGAIGLLLWLGGYLAHNAVKGRRTAKIAPLIDREHDILYDAAAHASRLLS